MRSLAEHLQLVMSRVRPLEPLALPLLDANGCVLAVDVVAPASVPAYHESAVMGYAARASDIAMASPTSVLGMRQMVPGSRLAPGCVVPVNAGTPLPYGADCVIPVGHTDQGTPVVRVSESVAQGENVIMAGSQIKQGDVLLSAGTVLKSREIALLAAIGIGKVTAHPRPRIAVITTGTELYDTSRSRAPGVGAYKPDINGVALACAIVQTGALSYRVGPVDDDPAVLRKILDDQLGRADMVVTTGGIGAEPEDMLRPVLATMGTVDFAWVALEPGKVQGVGSLGASNVPLIALPGSPAAAFVGTELFVRPVVRKLMGYKDAFGPRREVRLSEPLEGPEQPSTFFPVVVDGDQATPLEWTVADLTRADALVLIPPGHTKVDAGETLTAMFMEDC